MVVLLARSDRAVARKISRRRAGPYRLRAVGQALAGRISLPARAAHRRPESTHRKARSARHHPSGPRLGRRHRHGRGRQGAQPIQKVCADEHRRVSRPKLPLADPLGPHSRVWPVGRAGDEPVRSGRAAIDRGQARTLDARGPRRIFGPLRFLGASGGRLSVRLRHPSASEPSELSNPGRSRTRPAAFSQSSGLFDLGHARLVFLALVLGAVYRVLSPGRSASVRRRRPLRRRRRPRTHCARDRTVY